MKNKNLTPLPTKNPSQMGTEGKFYNAIKAIYEKLK